MSDCENSTVEEELDEKVGVEELSDEDLENVAGGWTGDDGGGG